MDTKSFHLRRQPAPEGILKGVSSEGEFHEIIESASQVLLAGVAPTGENFTGVDVVASWEVVLQ